MYNFGITGVAGYIAPRHLQAIHDSGNNLVAALDPNDSVGILDRYFPETRFFTEFERFDRYIEKLRRGPEEQRMHYLSICSPNYLHDSHIRYALRMGADAICEKPLVLKPWNLDAISDLESETGGKVNVILQLRHHPDIIKLREKVAPKYSPSVLTGSTTSKRHDVCLTYITARGPWYHYSWKGDVERSGGLASNIGVHFFDMLIWLFGNPSVNVVHTLEDTRCGGYLELERARVRWFLSIDRNDLPKETKASKKSTFRSIVIDGSELEFSDGFTDLHTVSYREILAGRGFGAEDARASLNVVHAIRNSQPSKDRNAVHPFLENATSDRSYELLQA